MKFSLLFYACGLLLLSASGATHDASFSKEGLFKANVNALSDTRLEAHPGLPLDPHLNTLWCGTLQLAWNEAVRLAGEKLDLLSASGKTVPAETQTEIDLLNRMDFQRTDLDPSSYVALADFERDHIEDKIRTALDKTFHGDASPELIPPTPRNPGPDDFVAYAYLYKNLAFAVPFADLPTLTFGGKSVKSFGFNSESKLKPEAMEQVLIYDYKSPQDFIVELKTKATNDQLILARVSAGATLAATCQAVLQRMQGVPPENSGPVDLLAIPKLNFDLRRDFKELEGLVFKPSGLSSKIQHPLKVAKMEQLVRFQLNEKGAVLKSEATIVMRALAMMPRRHLVFDQPFLLMMKQRNASEPYLALWIANPTLLVPATGAPRA